MRLLRDKSVLPITLIQNTWKQTQCLRRKDSLPHKFYSILMSIIKNIIQGWADLPKLLNTLITMLLKGWNIIIWGSCVVTWGLKHPQNLVYQKVGKKALRSVRSNIHWVGYMLCSDADQTKLFKQVIIVIITSANNIRVWCEYIQLSHITLLIQPL